jgi:carboxylesterase
MQVVERGNPAPFAHQRGPLGCLLLHGFPGSPAEMRLLGDYLAERDVSVVAPLLPGMGTIPEDLRGVRWGDWVAVAEAGLDELRANCSTIFLCGLSMGGALSLYLASRVPVAGVAALAPAIRMRDHRFDLAPVLSPLRPWVEASDSPEDLADPQNRALTWHYQRYPSVAVRQVVYLVRAMRRSLQQIRCPVLIVQSPRDGPLNPEGARWAYERIPVADKCLVWLQRSGHNIVVDVEREEVFAQTYRFIARVAGLLQ